MDTNEMEYRMSSDPPMLQSNFLQSRGCPYFNRDHDRLPSLSHQQAQLLAHPSLSQHHHHPNNNNNNNNSSSSGIPYGSETNYNHPSRQHTHSHSSGQPQHAVHPRAQPPSQTNHINHANNSNISNTNHTNHPPPRLPLPLFDPVHANNNNNASNGAWYQQGQNPGRHVQTHPVGVPAPPLPQMNTESNPAAALAAAAAGASGAAAAASANAGSAPDGHFGQGNVASLGLGSGPGPLSGAPATGRGPTPGNSAGNATSGAFHSVLTQPGVSAANGQQHQEAYPYDPSGLGGGPGPYHYPSSMSRQHRSQAALASHLSQLNYRLVHDINRQEGHQSQLYTQHQHGHQHQPQHHPQHQPQHQQPQHSPQQRRHRATGSIGRSHQPASNLRGPSLPALVAPFHTPISIPAMATESTAPVDSSPNATPTHAHDIFYGGGAGESRHRLAGPQYGLSATGELTRVEAGASMAPSSHAEPPASALSVDSSPTADHRRNQAQARLRASLQADYDSGDEPYGIEDMLADDEATMQFIDQISHEAGAAREQRHNFEEVRIRQQQLLRGQMSTKRVASKKALSQLQIVDIASLDEGEKTCVICYNEFGIPSPEGTQEVPLRLPNCQHIFGEHCIKKWFEESDSCPYCRDKVHSESVTIPSSSIRQYLQRHHGRPLPQLMRHGGALPPPSHSSGRAESPPRIWQTGDRRSPPSDPPEARRRTRSRLNSGRLSASGSMAPSQSATHPPQSATQPPQTQPTAHDRPNLPHASQSWTQYSGSTTHHARQSMPAAQRMHQYSQAYPGGAPFMPPMHLQPGSMPSGQGHHSPAFGFHGQLNPGEDGLFQAPPSAGGALPPSEPMHMAYSQTLPPVGSLDGGSLPPAMSTVGTGHQNQGPSWMP